MPEVFAEFIRITRAAGSALPRHAGHGVHRRARQALDAADPQRQAHRAAPRCAIAVDMANEGLITSEEAVTAHRARLARPVAASDPRPEGRAQVIATGLPASPGAACGEIVFSSDEAETLEGSTGHKVILVRVETSPEDIHGMHAAEGILTTRGGMTSPCGGGGARHGQALRFRRRRRCASTMRRRRLTAARRDVARRATSITIDGAAGAGAGGRGADARSRNCPANSRC